MRRFPRLVFALGCPPAYRLPAPIEAAIRQARAARDQSHIGNDKRRRSAQSALCCRTARINPRGKTNRLHPARRERPMIRQGEAWAQPPSPRYEKPTRHAGPRSRATSAINAGVIASVIRLSGVIFAAAKARAHRPGGCLKRGNSRRVARCRSAACATSAFTTASVNGCDARVSILCHGQRIRSAPARPLLVASQQHRRARIAKRCRVIRCKGKRHRPDGLIDHSAIIRGEQIRSESDYGFVF